MILCIITSLSLSVFFVWMTIMEQEVCLKEEKHLFLWILLQLLQSVLGKRNKNFSHPETATST